jgi:hypothetical protein
MRLCIQPASETLRRKTVTLYSRIGLCGMGLAVTAVHIQCLLAKVSHVLECVKIAKECETLNVF